MYRSMTALLTLPLFGLLLLAGIIESAVAAEPAAPSTTRSGTAMEAAAAGSTESSPLAASEVGTYLRSDFSLAPAASAGCCAAMGGPYEPMAPAALTVAEPTLYHWERLVERRLEQSLTLPPRRPLNGFSVRF
jgi:hypothetical protein